MPDEIRKDAEEMAERMQQMPTDLREYVRGYVAGVTDCRKKPEEKED